MRRALACSSPLTSSLSPWRLFFHTLSAGRGMSSNHPRFEYNVEQSRPISSVDQSVCLRSRRSQVRILHGTPAPYSKPCSAPAGLGAISATLLNALWSITENQSIIDALRYFGHFEANYRRNVVHRRTCSHWFAAQGSAPSMKAQCALHQLRLRGAYYTRCITGGSIDAVDG